PFITISNDGKTEHEFERNRQFLENLRPNVDGRLVSGIELPTKLILAREHEHRFIGRFPKRIPGYSGELDQLHRLDREILPVVVGEDDLSIFADGSNPAADDRSIDERGFELRIGV